MSKFFLLFVTVLVINNTQCSLYGEKLRQYFHNIYAPTVEQRTISPRNIPTLTGSGVFQEPSSRDLDVGFAIGVKDEGEASDVLINNHSSKTYSPAVPESSNSETYLVQEPSSSKELNIGVYVDPKNGMKYYAPGFVPISGRSNVDELLPERYVPQMYPMFPKNQLYPPLNSYQPTLFPYPETPRTPNYVSRFPPLSSSINTIPYPYQMNSNPAPLSSDVFSGPIPEHYFDKSLNIHHYQQPVYPHQNYFQQPPEVDSFSSAPYFSKNLQFFPSQIPETVYRTPMTANIYDEGIHPSSYSERFARRHGGFPYRNPEVRYNIPLRNFQKAFQVQEQIPRGSYGHLPQPVMERQEPQAPEIIVDRQGMPVMSSQPYGERQVGAFKLRNDHGYQVTMNVPPVPVDGPADGVLVMEMKANLYRPLS